MPGAARADPEAGLVGEGARVLSYNVFCRPKPIVTNRKDWRRDRLRLLARRAPAYDVLCLQEFFQTRRNRGATQAFLRDLGMAGFRYAVSGPRATAASVCGGCQLVDGGLLLASRHPILVHDTLRFRTGGHSSDGFCCKGALYARILVDPGPGDRPPAVLHLFTTHLQASYFSKAALRRDVSGKPRVDPAHGPECFRLQTAEGGDEISAKGAAAIRAKQFRELAEFMSRCLAIESRVGPGLRTEEGSSVIGGPAGPGRGGRRLSEYCLLMGDLNVDKFEQPLDFEGCFVENSARVTNCYDIDAGVYLGPDAPEIARAYDAFYGRSGRRFVQPPAMGRPQPSLEYEMMMRILGRGVKWGGAPARAVDALGATLGGLTPATFGDSMASNGCLLSRDRQITAEDDRCTNMSIDHCIQFFRNDGVAAQAQDRATSCLVDTCLLRRGEHHILPLLSDHCALDAVVGHPRGNTPAVARSVGADRGPGPAEQGSLARGARAAQRRLLGPAGLPAQRPVGTSPVPDSDPEGIAEMLSEIIETSEAHGAQGAPGGPAEASAGGQAAGAGPALVPASEEAGARTPRGDGHNRQPSRLSASAGSRSASAKSSKRSSARMGAAGGQGEDGAGEKRGGCETGA